ncbi:ABC transporter substrate-binding protein [Rhodococcus sp. 06-462-5]|uniref:ABC transporter substrate-binding protein n=1 Tax=unclassified Rhodococcus (in: high G+C Gram-positive bacteria) TaxID=192944 RepID=UPI000B9AFDCB|nr:MULTISPECIES: ABC transporter substrate-binding protein [unclassified Rhodococcus (in: high G+C Gram-positive bacteria)]OZC72455.1 ABC transporter substrate-binding protein [Rhodococcus sp. 06-462-5]OZE58443.1 ABC transporter substrate-binding protein [Rhodococcus sp. 02-925g]
MKRTSLGYALALITASALVACTSGPADDAGSEARTVTIDTIAGPTQITGTPERIVAFGQQWVDALLEFDVQPVGYVSAGSYGDERELFPWQTGVANDAVMLDAAAVEQMGGAVPTEAIAALEPDLILVSGIASADPYKGLPEIAPTVLPKDTTVESWQAQIETLGEILDRKDDADRIIAEGNKFTDAIASDLPGLSGRTAVLSQFIFDTQQLVVVADPEDGAALVFDSIGLSVPEDLANSPDISGGRITLSPERIDALTADVVVVLPNGGTGDDLRKLPGFTALPAVTGGGLAVVDYATVVGINLPSKASVEFSLNKIRPQLEAVGS